MFKDYKICIYLFIYYFPFKDYKIPKVLTARLYTLPSHKSLRVKIEDTEIVPSAQIRSTIFKLYI